MYGLLMSAAGMTILDCLIILRGAATRVNIPVAMCMMVAASLLQACFIWLQPEPYRSIRHQVTWFNRTVRLLVLLGPILNSNFDAVYKLMPAHHVQQQAVLTLLGIICTLPLMQVYTNLCFVVPVASLLLWQIPAVMLTTMLSWYSQQGLVALPGMQELADSTCGKVRGVFELTLHVLIDQGTMPGVPAAGFDAFGTESRCAGRASFLQLMLFANLVLAYYLPVHTTMYVELCHKLNFWRSRGVEVAVQASPLLPMPGSHLASYLCVLLCSQVLLWFLAEGLTGLLL